MSDAIINARFISYLSEFRQRLLNCFVCFALFAIPAIYFSRTLYSILAFPLLAHLPQGSQMIVTALPNTFLTPLKFACCLAFFFSVPLIIHQVWSFVSPSLYKDEKRQIWPLILFSIFLFYLGIAFAYFIVLPILFQFFISITPEHVAVMPDIQSYLSLVFQLFFVFGLAFEVPVVTIILMKTGIIDRDKIRIIRPYIIVGAFVLGMVLTPPDIISQVLLAIPLWGLFELGVLLGKSH